MSRIPLALIAALALAGCASTPSPEVQVAGAVKTFQQSATEFTTARAEIIKKRQLLLNEVEEHAAVVKMNADHLTGVWTLAGEDKKLKLHKDLIAATKAAGDADDALDKLLKDHQQALAQANTKVKVQQDKLTDVAKSLTSLGAEKGFAEQVQFYFDYLQQTKDELDKLQQAVDANKTKVNQSKPK